MIHAEDKKQNPQAEALLPKNIRLWKADDKEKLLESFSKIQGSEEQRMEIDGTPSEGGKYHSSKQIWPFIVDLLILTTICRLNFGF